MLTNVQETVGQDILMVFRISDCEFEIVQDLALIFRELARSRFADSSRTWQPRWVDGGFLAFLSPIL